MDQENNISPVINTEQPIVSIVPTSLQVTPKLTKRKVNIYLILFVVIVILAVVILLVSFQAAS
ncbi:MAG: hypothetical protein AAB624_03380 [Patescibacteria group bacterium]